MDDAKRRALIRSQAVKKKESGDMALTATVANNPSIKWKPPSKGNRPAKKPKVSLEPVVGLMAKGKTVTLVKHGAGKGLMKALSTTQEKPPVLLREDSKHALEQISPIISAEEITRIRETTPRRPWGVWSFCSCSGNPTCNLYVHPLNLLPI